jgi:hypothetical protein
MPSKDRLTKLFRQELTPVVGYDPFKDVEGDYWFVPYGQDSRRKNAKEREWRPGQAIRSNRTHLLLAFEHGWPLFKVPRKCVRWIEATGREAVRHLDYSVSIQYMPGWGYINQEEVEHA